MANIVWDKVLSLACLMVASTALALDVHTADTLYWSRVSSANLSIPLYWPEGATGAHLACRGLAGPVQVVDLAAGTASWTLKAWEGDAPKADDILTLTVSYLDGSGAVLESATAQLAVTKSGAGAETVRMQALDSKEWMSVGRTAVVPYDTTWLAGKTLADEAGFEISAAGSDGLSKTLKGSGWFGWNFKRAGLPSAVELSLASGSESLSATLESQAPGFLLILR